MSTHMLKFFFAALITLSQSYAFAKESVPSLHCESVTKEFKLIGNVRAAASVNGYKSILIDPYSVYWSRNGFDVQNVKDSKMTEGTANGGVLVLFEAGSEMRDMFTFKLADQETYKVYLKDNLTGEMTIPKSKKYEAVSCSPLKK